MTLGTWFCDFLSIKRRSFYVGDLYFTISTESPYFSSGNDVLNKVHFKFLGVYFASRLKKRQTSKGYRKDMPLVRIFESTCGVKVGTYQVRDASQNTYDDWSLPDAVVTVLDNRFVGSLNDCYWMLEKSVFICREFPSAGYSMKEDAWIGWSHRAKAAFKIGDRLFDPNHMPVRIDYTQKQWDRWYKKWQKLLKNSDPLERKWIEEEGISYVIPFKQRGPKLIQTMDEAKQAAINFSKYVS